MDKSNLTPTIQGYKVGGKDQGGNLIVQILSVGNEYCIYEIETEDINNRLKVVIDGFTDVSEKQLIARFDSVKQEYVKAKGMLYRSSNYGMMKNRIAHALSTCFTNDDQTFNGKKLFESLCSEISAEQKRIVTNRVHYLLPVAASIAIAFLSCYLLMQHRLSNTPEWQIASGFLASSLGVGASIFTGIKKLHFEEYPYSSYYSYIGIERLLLGYVVGAVAFIAIKSGLFSPAILEKNYWANLMVFVAAGFSEQFIPSLIKKVDP